MKYLFAIIILSSLSFQSFSQRTSDLKIGLGLPVFFGNESGAHKTSEVIAFPTFSVEKPIPIEFQRDEKISINPGVAFFYFKENDILSNALTLSSKELTHMSFNGYIKFLYQLPIQKRSEAFIYFGLVTGVHFYSRTTDKKIIQSQNVDNPILEEDINVSGKAFFSTIYDGVVAGFQPNAKVTNKFVPSFELAFYPNFVSKQRGKASAVQLTVLLGINM